MIARTPAAVFVVVLFAVLTVGMAAPWSLHQTSRVVVDNPDTHLFLWTLGWDVHALTSQPLAIFDANIYAPNPNTLAYSENAIGSAVLAAPVLWATGDLVLTLNLVLLSACALCGVGTWFLARRLGLGMTASIVAGLVFAFAPSRFFRMSQLHQNTVQWIPFALAYLHTYVAAGRARDLRLALAFFTLQALTSGHGAVYLVVAMTALVVFHGLAGWPLAPWRRLRDVGLTGALLLAPAVLLLLPYRRARADVGLDRTAEVWAVTPESFLASPSLLHQAVLSWFTTRPVNDLANAFLFPGYLAVLLAALALWPDAGPGREPSLLERAASRRHVWFYALLLVLSVLFYVDGPGALWPWVRGWPGFNFIRVSSRFVTVTTLALAVLAGFGVERLLRGRPRPLTVGAGLAVGALLLAEYSTYPFTGAAFTLPRPAIVDWLASQPRPFVVAEVPVPRAANGGAYERFETAAMLHSTAHWQPTVHGYSGTRPEAHDRLYRAMNTFPDAASVAALRAFGVTHVLVHRPLYPVDAWPLVDAQLRRVPELRVVHTADDGLVCALLPEHVQ